MPLADLIEQHALRAPDTTALAGGETEVSYAQWAERVNAAASVLMQHQVLAGDTVALGLPQSPFWQWAFMLAGFRIGATVVVLGAQPVAELRTLPGKDPHVVALQGSALAHLPGVRAIGISPAVLATLKNTRQVIGLPTPAQAELTAGLILFGGGRASAAPLPLRLDATLVLARCQKAIEQQALGTSTRLLSALNFSNPLSIELGLATWLAGGTVLLATAKTTLGVAVVDSLPDRLLVTPLMLPELLSSLGTSATPGRELRRLIVAGGPLPLALARQAEGTLATDVRLALAAPETSLFSLGHLEDLKTPGCVGALVNGAEALTLDIAGQPRAAGQTGRLHVRQPLMASAYLTPAGSQNGALKEGWFATGLQGYVTGDGHLYITGADAPPVAKAPPKAPQRMLTRGELETELARVQGMDEVCVLSQPLPGRRTVPVIVYTSKTLENVDALSQRIGALQLGLPPFHLVRVQALPRDKAGAVLRTELATQIEAAMRKALTPVDGIQSASSTTAA